jgi:hypothetical protein
LAQAEPISIRSGEDRVGVDIAIQPVRTVAVSGALMDDAGPVGNFGVHLLPADRGNGESLLEIATTATDGSGRFLFPAVPAGQYSILALKNPAGPSPQGPAASSPIPGVSASIALSVGDQAVSGVVLALRPGVQVTGRLVFVGTSPLPPDRQRQTLMSVVRTRPVFRGGGASPTAALTLTGEFSIRGVAPGRYVLRTPDIFAGWALQSVIQSGQDFTDVPFNVADTDVANLVVTFTDQPAQLTGTVRGGNGNPDPEASVMIFPVDQARWPDARVLGRTFRTVRVSATGSFTAGNMIPGEYYAVAVKDAAAADWPDLALLQNLRGPSSTVRIEAGQKASVSLTTVALR